MSSFTEPLVMTPMSEPQGGFKIFGYHFFGRTVWKLEHDFVYHVGKKGSRKTIKIKKGFRTDLASIPRSVWAIYPPYSPEYGKAAVLHDGIYASELFDRETCDDFLLEGMEVLEAGPVTQRIIYMAVRLFGGAVWANHTKKSIANARKYVSKKGFKSDSGKE